MLRLVYTSDLHGHLDLYRAAGEAALRMRADAVVLGGDLCPGTPSASATHLPAAQPEFLLEEVAPLVESWQRAQPGLRVFAIPGNDDCQTILPALEELEARGLVENLHCARKDLGAYALVGLSFVPPTPFSIKDFERRDEPGTALREPQFARSVVSTPRGFRLLENFQAYLEALPSVEEELAHLPITDAARTIAVIHGPPFGTNCDVLCNRQHIGSAALRRWIEQKQPRLTLHGHIHESPQMSGAFADRLGNTIVINPGCDHQRPHLVIINLDKPSELEHTIYGRTAV